jgi:hypothetical protein
MNDSLEILTPLHYSLTENHNEIDEIKNKKKIKKINTLN